MARGSSSRSRLTDQLGNEIGQLPVGIPPVSAIGALFVKTPTFLVGGAVTSVRNLSGALYVKTATFSTGTVTTTRDLVGVLYVRVPTFLTGAVASTRDLVEYPPIAVLSNDGWDTGPSGGGDLVDALEGAGSDYITVTV